MDCTRKLPVSLRPVGPAPRALLLAAVPALALSFSLAAAAQVEEPAAPPADEPAAPAEPAPPAPSVDQPVPEPAPEPTPVMQTAASEEPQLPAASAQPDPPPPAAPAEAPAGWKPYIEAHADMHNLVLYRNDTDFDRTAPFYDRQGQSVGAFATIFRPMVTFHTVPNLRLYYEAELGMNFWSKNNPDQESGLAPDIFVLKHRQVYSEGELSDGAFGFRVGYQFFQDPTGLFIGHWIGAASAWYAWSDDDRLGMFVGQVPDATYEGVDVRRNNFTHDITVFGPRLDLVLGDDISFSGAVYALHDAHVVDRTRWVVAPAAHLELSTGDLWMYADGIVQAGREQKAALGGADQTIFAWAAQGHAALQARPLSLDLNALVLSSDDAKDSNKNNGTFLYSSRSGSATLILTEDEIRNWYDQYDRVAAEFRGGFWEHRAGLLIGDIKTTLHVTEVFRPALILGAASVLQRNNALNNRFVGVEGDLDMAFHVSDHLVGHVVAGALLPGQAAAALVNQIDRKSTSAVWMLEGSLLARF